MNLHLLSDIDKSFTWCYVKKKRILYLRECFMLQKVFFTLFAVVVLSGCRSGRHHLEHAGHAGDHGQKHKVTVSMDISEAAPSAPSKKFDKPDKPAGKNNYRKVPAPKQGKQVERPKNTSQVKPGSRSQESSPRGIDRNLNSVEQQHLNEVRERNRQQQRDSERNVFGGFTDGLFKKQPK